MIVELRQMFKLTAEDIASLGAIYLYAYSLLQIPLGFIIDRFGVRRVLVTSLMMCILGTVLYTYAVNIGMLQLGRFFIGMGSAPIFICAVKFTSDYLPQKYQGLFMGATLTLGTIGALLSGKFLVVSLDNLGWNNTLVLCMVLGGLILLPILKFVPGSQNKDTFAKPMLLHHLKEGLCSIFRKNEILIYSVLAVSVYTPLCILADLWGVMYLMEKFSLTRADAAQMNLYMYAGLAIGSLVIPYFSLKKNLMKEMIFLCSIGIAVAILILLYAKALSIGQLGFLLTSIGVFCGAEMICFAGAARASASSYTGLTLGVVNTLNMLGEAITQQVIGWYLDAHWTGTYGTEGARHYGEQELSSAFLILVFLIVGCTLMIFWLPKKQSAASYQESIETAG